MATRLPLILLSFLALLQAERVTGAELTVDDIIARNTEAMGGRVALDAVRAVDVSLHVSNPKFEVDGVYHAARPGRMRIDIIADGKHVFTEAFYGEMAGTKKESCGGLASIRRPSN